MASLALVSLLATTALAFPAESWTPAGPGDVRGPCPMLNTLSNHGHLPHSGRDFTEVDIIDVLGNVLNIDAMLAGFLFSAAVATNPQPNATSFSLDQLGTHGILEHDGSLRLVTR